MSIFQNSVVKKYLASQNKTHLSTKWNEFKIHFHNFTIQENIRNSKEEQYQAGFLRDLFVKIFGYTLNPDADFNLTTEYKNVKDSKKADGAILFDGKVLAVIELKGTNTTDLGKIETQAFGYKNNQPDCNYIITSNFEKIRFYIDNAIEHIEFNLFTLTETDFELLHLLLAFENLSNGLAKRIKDESINQENVITKKLYHDYSIFKRELHHNLVLQNPNYEPLELFKKSQKLIDRFLFLFFAEDRQLLPPNSVRLILNDWRDLQERDVEIPLYDRFKKYFEYLNTGYKGKRYDVYAYNGGLFKPDEVLDSVTINDELLYKHALQLSAFDFASEVDVNILGHIFENSLNELDELKAELEGVEIDKTKTKRKKDGVFYTPKYITKYIVDNTVGTLCNEKKGALQLVEEDYIIDKKRQKKTMQALVEKLHEYRKWLLQLTICDPACGSGAFLNQALDFLITEHKYIDELQAKLFGDAMVMSDVEKSILENNLFGVDLNEESVEIAKLSLWLRTAQPNRKLNDLNNNIKCGNSLIDDVAIAGEKAFHWQTAFPQVFEEKNKKAYHLVFTTHNSRVSQRMITYNVQKGPAIELNLEQEIGLTKIFKQIILENNYNCLAYNICTDHVHLILVCEEEELNNFAKVLKGKSSYLFQSNGFKPIGEALWSQKFFFAQLDEFIWSDIATKPGYVATDAYLDNAITYIKTNRKKHNLPDSKELKSIINDFTSELDLGFATEYKGGFDVVIGNPPYGAKVSKVDLNYFVEKYKNGGLNKVFSDTYISFYILGLSKLLKQNGLLGYIAPNTWRLVGNGSDFRNYLTSNKFSILKIIQHTEKVFVDATVDVDTLIIKNSTTDGKINVFIGDLNKSFIQHQINQKTLNEQQYINLFLTDIIYELKDKIENISNLAKDLFDIKNGVKPYEVGKGKPVQTKEILELKPYTSETKTDETFTPLIGGSSFNKYQLLWNNDYWIKYGEWLAAPRNKEIFEAKEKLIFRQTSDKIIGMYITDGFVMRNNTHLLLSKNNIEIDLKFALSIFNCKLINYYYQLINPEKGEALAEVKAFHLENLPIINISKEAQQPFIEKADTMLSFNKELQVQSQKFQRTLQRKFELETLPKKLQDWYLLPYSEFIKELTKQKVKLTLSQEAEWEDYFTTEAKKVLALKIEIDSTDKAIDAMVYELYGLSKEEIEIVENS